MKKKLILLGVVISSLSFLLYCEPPEYAYHVVGGVEYCPQESETWCGAACLEMYGCLKYPNTGCKNQPEIMSLADNQYPYGILNDEEIYGYMNTYLELGKFADYRSTHSTFLTNLKQLIGAVEPFICHTGSEPVGHWVFVIGYRTPWDDPYSDPVGVVYADPAKVCDEYSNCYGIYYDASMSVFFSMTGSSVGYVGMALIPKTAPDTESVPSEDDPLQPPLVYANYYDYLSKEAPGNEGIDIDKEIKFADAVAMDYPKT